MRERWNHNIHYHSVLLDAMPEGCGRALDVGCGEGTLARKLRRSGAHVSAIDADAASIDLARAQGPAAGIEYVHGDFLTFPFAGRLVRLRGLRRGAAPHGRHARVASHGRAPAAARRARD